MRWALQDPVEADRHPLGILIFIIIIIVILIRRVPLGPPLMPCLSPMLLERLPLEVLSHLLLPLYILHRLVLLGRGAPFLVLNIILLHRGLRGPRIDCSLAKQT